jgi:hypothetical protein
VTGTPGNHESFRCIRVYQEPVSTADIVSI